MRNMLIVFFIICLFFLIIFLPFKTRFMAHVDVLNFKCFYVAKSWIVKFLCGMIVVDNGKIKMINEKTFLSGSYNKPFVKNMASELFSRLDIKKVEFFFTGGFKENSFSSAMMCGGVLSFIETLYGYLSLSFDNVKMYKDIKPTFEEDNLELTVDVVVSISLIKILKSLLQATSKTQKLREVENEG